MCEKKIYVQKEDERVLTSSLYPYFAKSLEDGAIMDKNLMRPDEPLQCPWVGFGITKGVTRVSDETTVLALPRELKSGLHGKLIQGFRGVDPVPLCYNYLNHVNGFGGFVRWVYFTSPTGRDDVIGIDFSLAERPTSGVATSVFAVSMIAKVLRDHGVPRKTKLVLLNCRMCENPEITKFREQAELFTLNDWCEIAPLIFGPNGYRCPRCGLPTFLKDENFCSRCGCRPELIWDRR